MQSTPFRVGAVVALAAAAVVLFFVLSGDDDGGGGEQAGTSTIVVKGGEPVGGVQELEYTSGDQVQIKVQSDVADEVHVHGYDLMKDVAPGGPVSFDFPADIEGLFEIELEDSKTELAELSVEPG